MMMPTKILRILFRNDDDVSRDAEDWCGGRRFERGAEIGVRVDQVRGGVRVGVVAEEDVEGKV